MKCYFSGSRLFTVSYFFVRSSRASGSASHPLSSFDAHPRWLPPTHRARSRRSYGKIGDCEQSIQVGPCITYLNEKCMLVGGLSGVFQTGQGAVSYFSLQSYYTRDPSARAVRGFVQITYCNLTSWFAIAVAEIRTRRILREKADCKQSTFRLPWYILASRGFVVRKGYYLLKVKTCRFLAN